MISTHILCVWFRLVSMAWGQRALFGLVFFVGCSNQQPANPDFDGDGWADAQDCGPSDPAISPSAEDLVGDGIDNNCDGLDGVDYDGDGYASELSGGDDCNDAEPNFHPGASDLWSAENGADENCDNIDGVDADGDGYPGNAPTDSDDFDCNDQDASVNPGVEEDPKTPVDDNCDDLAADVDEDGYESGTGPGNDCDDDNDAIHPGAKELCDAIDQDCDNDLVETFDDLDGDGSPDCIDLDVDGDGVAGLSDCDDLDPTIGQYGAHVCPYPWQPGIASCVDAQSFWSAAAGDDDDSATGSGQPVEAASGIYEVKLPGSASLEPVYCDMDRHGGGWTLALIASDDGQDTWTWAQSQLITNIPAPIGSLSAQPLDFASATDFKAPAYHALNFSDLLFVHHSEYPGVGTPATPFETWAAYDGVGDASETLPVFMLGRAAPSCLAWAVLGNEAYNDPAAQATAYPMSAGTLGVSGALCETNLYFHLGGHNSYGGRGCDNAPNTLYPHSYGPVWAAILGPDTHYFSCGSGPGWSSLGLGSNSILANTVDVVDESLIELPGLGFGLALGLNVAESGTGRNHLRMYIR